MHLKKLEGKAVYLRSIEVSDVTQTYVDWLNDHEVNQFLETRYQPQTLQSVSEFVKSKIQRTDEFLFAICVRDGGRHVGNIKLGPVSAAHKHGDISLFIGDKSAWGKRIASEAIGLISAWAFNELALNKLKAGCYAANEGSAKAFENNGFRREGLLREHFLVDGSPMDMIVLGKSARDHRSR